MAHMKASEVCATPMVGERPDHRMQLQGIGDTGPMTRMGATHRHPVEKLVLDSMRRNEQQDMMSKSIVHGLHAPLKAKMEREMLAQFQRLPGLPSSLVGLETVMGLDETIEFEDVFNLDADAAVPRNMGPNWGLHETMEKRLHMRF
eukprot:gnl/TRDRNA2_/TRDRNA2_182958_c0_seq1.p3 gnl/TRDRNA2_/TRDRNA2_182958_c0~~gnl/TRDRNA2_/TRDRNA2_182958_c0_seq1.p3  ORF type:complete len:146 (-),score=32.29 gnl/TRDRNA2_/TRDRNA2_182958_c0_seq1:93-530(-)